jgi:hypothetical protein
MTKKIEVRQFLTKSESNPVPCRKMEVREVVRESAKAIFVKLQGYLEPSSTCLHCGRSLTHPVSLLYGIGPVCGGHFHINPCASEEELERRYEEMKRQMASVTWEGWLPKGHIRIYN